MSNKSHGKRFRPSEKYAILDFLKNHTYKEACEKFGVSETTLARWRKKIMSGSIEKKSKLMKITLPDFWQEYLEELIEDGMGESMEEVIIKILRAHARSQIAHKKTIEAVPDFIQKLQTIIPQAVDDHEEVESFAVWYNERIIYASEKWGSIEEISPIITSWKKVKGRSKNIPDDLKEVKFQGFDYHTQDISEGHIVLV